MDTRNTNARTSAPSRNGAKTHPKARTCARSGGVMHDNDRHIRRFTVIGNHLAQHPELSLTAIGLAAHIQSLPTGACISIKTLERKFPEGRKRISDALNELEAHGYLSRTRERLADGRMVTRTVSRNNPGRRAAEEPPAKPQLPTRHPEPQRKALPAVPQPAYPAPDLLATALGILSDLRRDDPRLYLSATDVDHLAPGVATWLEREVSPEAVRQILTFALPQEELRRPAALLAHRLNAHLPPLPPFRPADPGVRHPLQNCDTCDRAYRAPEPGTCATCTPTT
ncbi:helix-turn-helix domain-containing protein [Streptomyces vietnamensis]|uniref:DNA-binding protein n=1 Tax=Streptomyces vietnamensis TaxID=362257 RepID=A0A0B5HVJ6_9ACTN|nr:helix-turn-helix domain-containing protein [Streptomyces vietnamensis]AJF66045.1 DNA-binding protein [Streptomyces vietnamensis]